MRQALYPYAVARIRSLERGLLTDSQTEQLVSARDAGESLKLLQDMGFGSDAGSEQNYEALLRAELDKTYALLRELAPDSELFDIFRVKNDYQNIKTLIKSELSGNERTDLLSGGGILPIEVLRQAYLERDRAVLGDVMMDAAEAALELYNKTNQPGLVDLTLDRATFHDMVCRARQSGNEFVIGLVQAWADTVNLKTLLRARKMGRDSAYLQRALVEGGALAHSFIISIAGLDDDALIKQLMFTPYGDICEKGMNAGFTAFEKMCDNYLLTYVKKARYISLTIEPLIAYLFAKENDIRSARIIMVGHINRIAPEIIRERLRDTY